MFIIAIIVHLITLAVSTAGSLSLKGTLWATSWYAFVSPYPLFILGGLSLFLLAGRPAILFSRERFSIPPGKGWRKAALPLLSIAIFLLLRYRHSLFINIYHPESGFYSPGPVIPALVTRAAYRILSEPFLAGPAGAVAAVSVLAGGAYAAAASGAAKAISESESGILSFFLLSGGFICTFFGGHSGISITVLLAALHIIASYRVIKEGRSLIPSSIFLLLALFSDPVSVYLLPGYIYLLISNRGAGHWSRNSLAGAAILILGWGSAEAVLRYAAGASPSIVPIFNLLSTSFRGGINGGILQGALNGILITGPGGAAALILLFLIGRFREEGSKSDCLLAIHAAMAVIMIISQQHLLREGIAWSRLLSAGPALYLFAAVILSRKAGTALFRRSAVILTAAGIIHILPILITNISPAGAEHRLASLGAEGGEAETIIARNAYENRDYRKSERYYLEAAKIDSTNSEAYYRLGKINMRNEDYFSAASQLARALRLDDENPEYRFALAEAYIEAEWFTDAAEQMRVLTARYGMNPAYWTQLGYALNHSGEYVEAVRAYRKALELEPNNSEYRDNLYSALLNRGAELQNEGRVERAEELYREGIKLVPERWEGYFNLASIRSSEQNYEEAERILKAALGRAVTIDYRVYMNLGYILEKQGKNDEALKYLIEAEKMNPLSPADQLINKIEKERSGGRTE